jgi:hypothetical protein
MEDAKKQEHESIVEEILANNHYEFKYKDIDYKVIKPTFKDKQEVYRKKGSKLAELLKNKDILLESALIAQFKERGVDIEEFDTKIKILEQKKNSLKEKLGEALAKQSSESDLKIYREEIVDIITEQTNLSTQKFSYVQFSLENQLKMFAYTYMTISIIFKKENDKWVRVWNTIEEFENCPDEEFINNISFYAGLILKDEEL